MGIPAEETFRIPSAAFVKAKQTGELGNTMVETKNTRVENNDTGVEPGRSWSPSK